MDREPALKQAARYVASLFDEYAASKGWGREDYLIAMKVNVVWNVFHVTLYNPAFPDQTSLEQFTDVMDFLDDRLKDDPDLHGNVRVLTTNSLPRFMASYLGENEVEIDLESINPGVVTARKLITTGRP